MIFTGPLIPLYLFIIFKLYLVPLHVQYLYNSLICISKVCQSTGDRRIGSLGCPEEGVLWGMRNPLALETWNRHVAVGVFIVLCWLSLALARPLSATDACPALLHAPTPCLADASAPRPRLPRRCVRAARPRRRSGAVAAGADGRAGRGAAGRSAAAGPRSTLTATAAAPSDRPRRRKEMFGRPRPNVVCLPPPAAAAGPCRGRGGLVAGRHGRGSVKGRVHGDEAVGGSRDAAMAPAEAVATAAEAWPRRHLNACHWD